MILAQDNASCRVSRSTLVMHVANNVQKLLRSMLEVLKR